MSAPPLDIPPFPVLHASLSALILILILVIIIIIDRRERALARARARDPRHPPGVKAATLRIADPSGLRTRTVPVPQGLLPLFQGLVSISPASAPMVCGRSDTTGASRGLSVRQAERIVQKAGQRSGVLKRFTPTVLRSTYAHLRLLAGHSIRAVQEDMGHRSIASTLRYKDCIVPNVTSPLDPESPSMVVRQMNVLLGRLAMGLAANRPTKPQGP